MRLSISALAAAFAAVPMAAAFSTYNATLHTDTACGDASKPFLSSPRRCDAQGYFPPGGNVNVSTLSEPYSMDGTGYTDCVALEQTHNSISAFEDEVSFFFLHFSPLSPPFLSSPNKRHKRHKSIKTSKRKKRGKESETEETRR